MEKQLFRNNSQMRKAQLEQKCNMFEKHKIQLKKYYRVAQKKGICVEDIVITIEKIDKLLDSSSKELQLNESQSPNSNI